MAQVTSFRSDRTASINQGVVHVQKVLALVNGSANSGDNIEVWGNAPDQKARLHRVSVRQLASLGAGATLTPQINVASVRTALAGATTAAAASKVDTDSDIDVPFDLSGGEVLELLVGGANITAAASVIVDIYYSARN